MSRSLIVPLLVALLVGGCDRPSRDAGQGAANAVASAPMPDEMPARAAPRPAAAGSVDRSHAGEAPPAATFTTLSGKPARLADFAGKPLLVNLWATWCAPCVRELPALDALAARQGLRVIAVSQDLEGADRVRAFLAAHPLKAIAVYLDPETKLGTAYQANLPTTIFYGADGRERWRVVGDRDWTAPDSVALVTAR